MVLVTTPLTWWGQIKNSGAFYGIQNYGENHYNSYNNKCSCVHAEVDACKRVARKYNHKANKKNKKVYNLVVIRTTKDGESLGMSRLCENCVLSVNNFSKNSGIKIKKIYYSNHQGEIEKTSLHKLINDKNQHISSYYRNHGYKSKLNN